MTVLIIFATVEGQTGKIARFAESEVRKAGHDVVLLNTADKRAPVALKGIDRVILAAPVHERRHPKSFEDFISASLPELKARKTLLLSVSLKAAFPDGMEDAEDFLIEMKMRTGMTPDMEALVAGAVRSGSYDYFTAMIVQHVVLRGQEYNVKDGEREFTDWDALGKTISEFFAMGAPSDRPAGTP